MADAPGARVFEGSGNGKPQPVIFLFLDGVGLGEDDPDVNPFAAARLAAVEALVGGPLVSGARPLVTDGFVFGPLDASLGHGGLPQSATGQTALLTGRNAADLMDGHYGPWPGPTLLSALAEGTLFHDAEAAGGAALANAYPPGYFEHARGRRLRRNAMAAAAVAAGVPQRDMAYYERGEAVAVDLAGSYFETLGYAGTDPAASAEALIGLARGVTLTVLDVWLTDSLGHARDMREAARLLQRLDAFVAALADSLGEVTLVITSDHGNLEDLSTKSHTTNAVPLLVLGAGAPAFAEARSILDIAPAVRSLWSSQVTSRG